MKGKHRIIVSTKRLKYDFEIRRNLTVIRGDSATGKTTLVDMIREYVNNPSGTPVELTCDKKCYVLEGSLWKEQLSAMQDSIVFIDEGNEFIKTVEFADTIQKTDNYYVIVSRESLPSLPYSVEEIYGIRTSGKYGTLKPCYHEFYRIYGAQTLKKDIKPEVVITEDSNSGYQFFNSVCRQQQLKCETMNGKSNVFHYLNMHKNERILVIADGAAFGSEKDKNWIVSRWNSIRNQLDWLKNYWNWKIVSQMGKTHGAMLSAILLGEKSGLDLEMKKLYQKNGLGHLLAISGLHMSLIGMSVYR